MIDKEQALEIIDKQDFFNDRAGRELWNDKPKEIQDEDIRNAHEDYEALKEYILNQPKVGEWIPVEDRLPKNGGAYLITAINDCGGVYMDVSYYDSQYKIFSCDGADDDNAIAWMDLPKPYEVKRK